MCYHQRQHAHGRRDNCSGAEYCREPDAGAGDWANAEGCHAVPSLIEGDDPARDQMLTTGQFLLPETDRERKQRGASEPGEAERGDGRARRIPGQGPR
jgi:hypothetical protein